MVLGIVGKIGSGKSTAIEYIEKNYGAVVFSCDNIAKDIMEKGESDYDPGFDGEIFISKKKQEECRTLLHPLVFNRICSDIKNILNKNNKYNLSNKNNINNFKNLHNFYEGIIIIESALPSDDMFKICDKVI